MRYWVLVVAVVLLVVWPVSAVRAQDTDTPTPTPTDTPTATATITPSATPMCEVAQIVNPSLELHLLDWVVSGAELHVGDPYTGTYDVHLSVGDYLEQTVVLSGGEFVTVGFAARGGVVEVVADWVDCESRVVTVVLQPTWSVFEVDRSSCEGAGSDFSVRLSGGGGDVYVDDVYLSCSSARVVAGEGISVVSVAPGAFSAADFLIVALLALILLIGLGVGLIVVWRGGA